MHTLPRRLARLLLAVLVAGPLTLLGCDAADPSASSTLTATGPLASAMTKSDVCHYDADAGTFHLITIADAAIDAHIAHGDAEPGADVPGQEGYVYGASCEAVLATCPCSFEGQPDTGFSEAIFENLFTGSTYTERLTQFMADDYIDYSASVNFSSSGTSGGRVCINRTPEVLEPKPISSIAEAEACRVALYALNDGRCASPHGLDDLCGETYFETFGE